jgi:hypothetical protein
MSALVARAFLKYVLFLGYVQNIKRAILVHDSNLKP